MRLDRNNNSRIIYRVAKSNLMGKRLSSFFSFLAIWMAVTLIATVTLFLLGTQIQEQRILDNMQHVMFMNITEEQMGKLASDGKTELMVPYKHCETDFQTDGVEYSFYYFESRPDKIRTYVPTEGRTPEKYEEIVVDKSFMEALDKEPVLGASVSLDIDGALQEFSVCGYTDDKYTVPVHPLKVSREFAEKSEIMKNIPYTALVRIKDTEGMPVSSFQTTIYQMAADYGIDRASVNLNGKFEEALQTGNVNIYIILLTAFLISVAGALVIYSIFYLSVASRVRQIGQLQTIGMTQKQVRKMISREGLILSGAAIPPGLIMSGVIAWLLNPQGWSFAVCGGTFLAVGVLGIVIVQISVRKPAFLAAKVSPIEAARGASQEDIRDGKGEHRRLTTLTLAWTEALRNRKKWSYTTISLAFGGILFMMATTFIASWDEEKYSRQDLFADGDFYIFYLYDHSSPRPYGITDMQLEGHLNEEMEEKLSQIPHVESVQTEHEAAGNIEYQGATFLQSFYPLTEESEEYFSLEAKGNNTYEYMAQNDAILITSAGLSESINGITYKPGDKVTFSWFDGKEHQTELEIAAVSMEEVVAGGMRSSFCMTDKTMKKLWPHMNTISSFTVSTDNYEKNGEKVELAVRDIAEAYPDVSLLTFGEQKASDAGMVKQLRMQIYGLSGFLILFSLFNLVNTIAGNFTARGKELSMLESIGMEEKQIRRMLLWENFFLVLPNVIITLTLGTAAGFGMVYILKKTAGYLEYQFPGVFVLLYIAGLLVIPVLVTGLCLREQNKAALAERIKNAD